MALVGPPNAGKSALHAALTGSHAQVGPYPFTTQYPQPGMLPFEDVLFQLVDLPPVTPEHPVAWLGEALQEADACLLVVDLGDPLCVDHLGGLHRELAGRRVHLTHRWPGSTPSSERIELDDPFAVLLPTLLLAAKADVVPNLADELAVLRELAGFAYPALAVSAETGAGLPEIGPWLFRELDLVRAYTKAPGRPPEGGRPFALRRGGTVGDVALLVHKDIATNLKYARLWPKWAGHPIQVGRDHAIEDGDLLELHV